MNELINIALRVSISYFLLLLLTRIMGRKQISQLTFFDFVSGISLGSISASTLVNPTMPVAVGVVALVVWTAWVLLTARITLASIPARKLIEAEPLMVIHKGNILEDKLASRNYNVNDLLKQLREKGVFDPKQVEIGIIETDGQISILKKNQFQPLTSGDMAIAGQQVTSSSMAGYELIIDGEVIEDNLSKAGIQKSDLSSYLNSQGVKDVSQVMLAIMNPQGEIVLDLKNDTSEKGSNNYKN